MNGQTPKRLSIVCVVCLLLTGSIFITGCTDNSGDDSDLNFQWVDISPGNFTMGEITLFPYEGPLHQVTISKGFQMGKYEVTQAQWKSVMGANPSFFSGGSNPVEQVSWNDCQSFISQFDELDPAYTYRLPTEAEWEYCARSGSTTTYFYGNDSAQIDQYAWHYYNSNNKTHPVGEKKPNAWGLYDMYGNVFEWCEDWFGEDYYENSPDTDPQGHSSGSLRVDRGGCWGTSRGFCTSASRGGATPGNRHKYTGFRLVRSPT